MDIPIPALLRKHRFNARDREISAPFWRRLITVHSWLSLRPRLYRWSMRIFRTGLSLVQRLPAKRRPAGPLAGWTIARDLPVPPRKTFFEQWREGTDAEQPHP